MRINPSTGLLPAASFCPSPNHDQRPEGCREELIVIHSISLPSGKFGGPYVTQLFCNQLDCSDHDAFTNLRDLRVSAHLFIRRTGEMIQFVPFHQRAWHAGISEYQGRTTCNDFSIGIELEGCDDKPFEDIQYSQLSSVICALLKVYPDLDKNRITGHCDIALGRKTDPGPLFDWNHLYRALNSHD